MRINDTRKARFLENCTKALILSYMVVFYQTCNWFMSLPDPNNAQAGFVSVVVGAGAA